MLFKKGYIAWNKGLTALTDERVKKYVEKWRLINPCKGKPPWNKGLTKFTDKRVKKNGENLKGKTGFWRKGLTRETDERLRIIGEKLSGENSSNWKGGEVKQNGRFYILIKKHPNCDSKGYVRRSRLIMEKHLGRFLKPVEIVHHINGNISDDKIKNLKVMTTNEHSSLHGKERYEKGG